VIYKDAKAFEAPPSVPGAAAHLHLKGYTQKVFPQKVTILKCYINILSENFTYTLWEHQRLLLNLVKGAV